MTTTMMRDSQVGDQWIKDAYAAVPVQRVLDPKTGLPNGNILTGPVRLCFTETLFTPKANSQNPNAPPKYGVTVLFPPIADFTIFWEEYYKICAAKFASYYVQATGRYEGLDVPFRDAAVRANKYAGFTPGCMFGNHTSKFPPPVLEMRNGQPMPVDPKRIHAGVWAVCSVNPYDYGINPPQPRKGVAFGLQEVLYLGDDTNLGGGPPDPRISFGGVNVRPPALPPGVGGFGQSTAAPPGAPGAPPLPPNYAPPGAPPRPPGAPPSVYTGPGSLPPPPPADDLSGLY